MSSQTPNLSPKPDYDEVVGSSFERGDNRWDIKNARRDWIIIGVLIIIYLVWTGTVFLFEPGIR
jgi:hypothetical protein